MLAAIVLSAATVTDARIVVAPPTVSAAPTMTVAQRGGVSLAQATKLALQVFPGRVVRAETVSRGGHSEHQIRIFGDDGRVRTVRVDAMTGQIL